MTLIQRIGSRLLGFTLSLAGGAAAADVVTVVSSRSTIPTLTKGQVADIFLGRVSRFPGGAIATPVDQAEGAATRDEFYEKVAGKSPAQVTAYWSKIIFTGRGQPPKTVADNVEMRKLIGANPNAIGYLDEKFVDASVRVLF